MLFHIYMFIIVILNASLTAKVFFFFFKDTSANLS